MNRRRTRSNDSRRIARQQRIHALADVYVDAALARGEAFSEALTNQAIDKAILDIDKAK